METEDLAWASYIIEHSILIDSGLLINLFDLLTYYIKMPFELKIILMDSNEVFKFIKMNSFALAGSRI